MFVYLMSFNEPILMVVVTIWLVVNVWGRRAYLVDKTTKLYKPFIQFCDGRRDYLASRVGQRMVRIWQKIDKLSLSKLYIVDL